MAAVYSAIIENGSASDYWDGDIAWAYDATSDIHSPTAHANQTARDNQYGSRIYSSCATWETDRDGNASAGDDEYGIIQGPWDSDDTASFDIFGWTTGTITLRAIGTARHAGIWDDGTASPHRLVSSQGTRVIDIEETDVTIDGMQIHNTRASDSNTNNIRIFGAQTNINISNNILNCADTGGNGVYADNTSVTTEIWNNVIYCPHGQGNASEGIHIESVSTADMFNNTVYQFNKGIQTFVGTTQIKNNISFTNGEDIDANATDTVEYNATDDVIGGTGNINPSDWSAEMTNYATYDFTLDGGAECAGAGVDSPNTYTDDITGFTRTSTWDIGAWELVSAAALSINLFDKIGIVENIDSKMSGLPVSAIDIIGVIENIQSVMSDPLISVYDVIGIVEDITARLSIEISLSEIVAIIENLDARLSGLAPFVYDQVVVTEIPTVTVYGPPDLQVNAVDEIRITEDITAQMSDLEVSVADEIRIVESETIQVSDLNFSVSDLIGIIENVNVSISTAPDLEIDVSDLIGITENVQSEMSGLEIVVYDEIRITEDVNIQLSTIGDLEIFVYDSVVSSETLDPRANLGDITAIEQITVSELIQHLLDVLPIAQDQITVAEVVTILKDIIPSVFDQIGVIEYVNLVLQGDNQINVSDNITVNEAITLIFDILNVNTSDQITVAENIVMEMPIEISAFDMVSIIETVITTMSIEISPIDLVTVSENVAMLLDAVFSIHDTIAVSEWVFATTSGLVVTPLHDSIVVKDYPIVRLTPAVGRVRAVFTERAPSLGIAERTPGLTFTPRQPTMDFEEQGVD